MTENEMRGGGGGGGGGKPEDGIGLQVDPHATHEHGDAGTKAGLREPFLLVDPHVLQPRHIVNLGFWVSGFGFRIQGLGLGLLVYLALMARSGPGQYTNRHRQTGRYAHRQMQRQRKTGRDTHTRV